MLIGVAVVVATAAILGCDFLVHVAWFRFMHWFGG